MPANSEYTSPMNARLKSLAAVSLTALYSLVGLTGESLHYLVEDIGLATMPVRNIKSGGYFHSHHPDNHVHFHRQHHHGEEEFVDLDRKANLRNEQARSEIAPNKQFHYSHDCPLLTIVSQLRLGHGISAYAIVGTEASCSVSGIFDLWKSSERAPLSLARGPPTKSYAA
jgi:hypothetical protein